jgi:hypothetical protein
MQSKEICSVEPNSENWMVQFQKLDVLEFIGTRAKQANQRWPILLIRGHPWYII